MRFLALLALVVAFSGCKPQFAPEKVTADSLPWTVEEARKKLARMSKEEVVALFGKPDEVSLNNYYYHERKFLKPDAGDRDTRPVGMVVRFWNDTNKVESVDYHRP